MVLGKRSALRRLGDQKGLARVRWSRFLMLGLAGVALYLLVPDGHPRMLVYALVTVLCLVALMVCGRYRLDVNRVAWRFLAIGICAWVVGDLISGWYLLDDLVVPVVSAADIAYLLGDAVFVAGILSVRDKSGRVFRVEDVLEALTVATGLGLTGWIFVIGTKSDLVLGADAFVRYWPVVMYIFVEGFLVSLLVILMLAKRARTLPVLLATLAFVSFSVSGWATYTVVDGLEHRQETIVSVGWLLGYVALSAAALYPVQKVWTVRGSSRGPQRIVDRTRLSGLSAAILMSPLVMAIQLARGVPVAEWGWVVLGSSILVVVLVAARMACFLAVLQRKSDELSEAAISDSVTGLANRRELGRVLDCSIATAGTNGVVVLIVDIDRFAQINETFGYPVGDRVLREIGHRLASAATREAVVGRLGGDQFVVAADVDRIAMSPVEWAEYFRSAVGQPMFVRDINVAIDATVGVVESSKYPRGDADAFLQYAHVALTTAKRGQTSVALYVPAMDCDRHEQMRLLGELETAIHERQLRVFFQPCLDLQSGKVSGVEALLRWQHPREGLIAPWSFLPDAEHTGLLPAITEYVLEDSLACCSVMRRRRSDFAVSVNLSVRNLLDPMLVEQVAHALQRNDVPATAVEFEVTETTAMTDPRRSVDSLVALRDLGVSIAIDDYGTGYSSLAYLRTLPVQTLKIDKSFVTAMNSQPTNSSIVRSTIELARSLGMNCVAEGVEDQKTLDTLRSLGCDGAQGFHIGRPVPIEELDALVDRIETDVAWSMPRSRDCSKNGVAHSDAVGSVARRN